MKFTKMHGCGNDFMVVEGPADIPPARVTVRVPGGDLFVRPGPSTFELAGPAEYVFEGTA